MGKLKWPGLQASRSALGLDIGPSTAKLVELSRSRSGALTLSHLGLEPLKPGAVVDGQIEQLDSVVQAVQNLVRQSGVRSRKVVMALPTKNVIMRRVRFRADMAEDELAVHVEAEAAGFVPFPVEDLALDFSVIGPAPGSAGEVEVLIAAARRDRVQDRLALAEAAGLEPLVVEMESNASQLAVQHWQRRSGRNPRAETLGLVELGHHTTVLKVFIDEELAFEREQAWGARRLQERVMSEYAFPEEEARRRMLSGDLPAGYHAQLVPEFVRQTALELDRLLQFFYASMPGRRLGSVVLAGGAAALEGLAQRVAEATGQGVSLLDPFEHMALGPDVDLRHSSGHASAYLTACGLALRCFET